MGRLAGQATCGAVVVAALVLGTTPRAVAEPPLPGREDAEVRRDAARAFLDAAREAGRTGDRAALERWLRAWATLAPAEVLPAGLEAEAAVAVAWAKQHGTFRLFASRLDDRVSAGVDDPAGISTRLEGWARTDGELLRLTRMESERADRWEYRLGAERSGVVTVVIEAVSTALGGDLALGRVVLEPQDVTPPSSPDPARMVETRPAYTQEPRPVEEPGLRWWWIAGGALAVVLAGAAVWQETRF